MRVTIDMECTVCHRRNYSTRKNKSTTTGRLELKKFCKFCRKHQAHKESK